MDYDSSTKFISSLAKFLQSLCNGYVEFDNGVEVIGHIYLSVDTGKKIDYILNEKVSKTDENSVTFISNSFHAQPAEKPKPVSKKSKEDTRNTDDLVEIDTDRDSSNQIELKSTNIGTIPRSINRSNQPSPSHRQGKRPSSPKSGRYSPNSKRSRTESQDQSHSHISDNGLSVQSPATATDPNRGHNAHGAEGPSLKTDFNDSYTNFNQGEEDNAAEESEERDVKPNIDTDVTFVKEEFAPPSQLGEGALEEVQPEDASAFSQMYLQPYSGGTGYSNQSYGMPGSSRLPYGAGERSEMFDSNQGPSHIEGEGMDPSGSGIRDMRGQESYASPRTSHQDPRSSPSNRLHGDVASLSWQQQRALYYSSNSNPSTSIPGRPREGGASMSSVTSAGMGLAHSRAVYMNKGVFGNGVAMCTRCGGKYTSATACAAHELKCNGTNRLMCHICKRVYSQMCALKEHLRGKHGVGDLLTCKYCGRSFKYKPQLYDHRDCVGMTNRKLGRMGRSPPNYPDMTEQLSNPFPNHNDSIQGQAHEEQEHVLDKLNES